MKRLVACLLLSLLLPLPAMAEVYWLPSVGEPVREDLLIYVGDPRQTAQADLVRAEAPDGLVGIELTPDMIHPVAEATATPPPAAESASPSPQADASAEPTPDLIAAPSFSTWQGEALTAADIKTISYYGEEGIGQINSALIALMQEPESLCFVTVSLHGIAEHFPPIISVMINLHSRVALDIPVTEGREYTVLAAYDEPVVTLIVQYPYGQEPFAYADITLDTSGTPVRYEAMSQNYDLDDFSFEVTCRTYEQYLEYARGMNTEE